MKDEVKNVSNSRKYYLHEFSLFDGDHIVTFNLLDIDTDNNNITVAVSNQGSVSVATYDLLSDGTDLYFEYGVMLEKVNVDDFESEGN